MKIKPCVACGSIYRGIVIYPEHLMPHLLSIPDVVCTPSFAGDNGAVSQCCRCGTFYVHADLLTFNPREYSNRIGDELYPGLKLKDERDPSP